MRISVTIGALGKRDGFLEISSSMALGAIDGGMLPFKRKLCLGVVEM